MTHKWTLANYRFIESIFCDLLRLWNHTLHLLTVKVFFCLVLLQIIMAYLTCSGKKWIHELNCPVK